MKECQLCKQVFPDELNHCPDDGDKLLVSLRCTPLLEGRYQLERRLGDGGMGIVYKAHHSYLKTVHAIKVILPDLVGHDPMFGTRFRQEAMIAAAIRHPNIVLVTDFGIAQDVLPFLVMEFIKGRSLQDIFDQKGTIPPEIALQLISAIAAGVGAAHHQGFVHRDLKPLNIMLADDKPIAEGVKILDFGLAKMKTGEMLGSFVQAKTSGLMGSPLYMAPEQWSEEELDNRADIYSLGIILYQMLAGDVPFKGSSMPTIMRAHLMKEPPPFSTLGVRVPQAVESVVRRALEKHPNDRFATVEDFISELRDAIVRTELSRRVENTLSQTDTLTLRTPYQNATQIETTATPAPDWIGASQQTLAGTRTPVQEDADRLAHEYEEAQRRAEEARKRAEQAAERRAEEEAARKLAEEEAARKRAKEAELREREMEEIRRQAALEAARKLIEEEEIRKAAEEERRRRAEEESARVRAMEDADRMAKEIAALQQLAEEARRQVEEEARKRSEEQMARRLAEEKAEALAHEIEEAQQRAEDARRRSEEEARKRAAEDAQRKTTDEQKARKRAKEESLRFAEVEAARLLAKEEADRLAREVEEAQRRAEEARMRTEEEARKRSEEEAARKRAEEEAKRLAAEFEEATRRVEEERQKQIQQEALLLASKEDEARKLIEEELQKRAEEVARKWAEEEAARRLAEDEANRKRAEADAKKFAEQEAARKRAEEQANRLASQIEEAERRAHEALLKAEQEAQRRAEEEERRRAEEEATSLQAKEEADRLAAEVEAAQLRAEEARTQAEEEARKRSEEATARKLAEEKAQSLEREVQEAQRRATVARKHVEEEARRQADEESSRKEKEEAVRAAELEERRKLLEEIQLLQEEKQQREEAMRVAELEAAALRQEALAAQSLPTGLQPPGPDIVQGSGLPGAVITNPQAKQTDIFAESASRLVDLPTRNRASLPVLIGIAAGVLLLVGIGYGFYRYKQSAPGAKTVAETPTNPPAATDLVFVKGGTFLMGRNDVPKSAERDVESPAHQVAVNDFYMDRTEVTNAEYADFVERTKYQAPENWENKKPPAGRERWPVTFVSANDARAFAAWRSTRDGVMYRLPTEEEWEYAARGGSSDLIYPWGNTWNESYANLGTGGGVKVDFPKPVGSYPQGASPAGLQDMIGNVWEWTSSELSFYPGNPGQFLPGERGNLIIRGGSHQSLYTDAVKFRGNREFPATSRSWASPDTRRNSIGFRLVREGK